MAGVAYKPLTVDFHETGFVSAVNRENQFGPWYTLSDQERQQLGSPWGPVNPQALNRYSYVLNNPMRWTDPGGHSAYLNDQQALELASDLDNLAKEIDDFLANVGYGVTTTTVSTAALIEWLEGFATSNFMINLIKETLLGLARIAIRAAGPSAVLGGLLLAQTSGDLKDIAQLIRDYSRGGQGIAIATGGGQIAFLDRANGNFTTWTPGGLNAGFRRYLILSNMPSSWAIGQRPVGSPNWWRGYHFGQDEKWIPFCVKHDCA